MTVTSADEVFGTRRAPGPAPVPGRPSVAGTVAFVTFVFFQVFNLLNVRNDTRSVFRRETLENRSAFAATAVVVILLVLLVEMDVPHGLFTTTDLTSGQWLACAAIGTTVLSWSRAYCASRPGEHAGRVCRVPARRCQDVSGDAVCGTTRTGRWAWCKVATATLPSRTSRTADLPREPTTTSAA